MAAKKYGKLKGKVPVERTEREQAVVDAMKERTGKSIAELALEYNSLTVTAAQKAAEVKQLNVKFEAIEVLIRQALEGMDAELVVAHGFNWSEKYEPYPVCDDPEAIVKYFKEHGMAEQLDLSKAELAARLKKIVKEEAENNELKVIVKEVVDPDTGESTTFNEVRSNIPGVKVFLKASLSRTKAAKRS